MVSYDDDDVGPGNGSPDEFDNDAEDEEMEDADQDADQDQEDDNAGEEEEDEDQDENDDIEEEDEDQADLDSPSRRAAHHTRRSPGRDGANNAGPSVVLTSPSPHRSPNTASSTSSFIPLTRPEALTAQAYDIVPTIAAPQSTSINAMASTPDMHYVFSGGSDGYVRMFNWIETANGKVPLTVAQKHPFVDSVMKAGSLLTYWETDQAGLEDTPQKSSADGDGKWLSPIYSLAVQHEALWLLSGLESGGINLQTCRHQAGTKITTLKEHKSAVSVLVLSQDETTLLSGSWDKAIHEWDLQTGKVKRSFLGSGRQIGAIEMRPMSTLAVPAVTDALSEPFNGTFASNNNDKPVPNGIMSNGLGRRESKEGEEDAVGSPSGSLFGDDHGSLFGEDNAGGTGAVAGFGDEDDDLTPALASGMVGEGPDAPADEDAEMGGMGDGGPVKPPETSALPATDTQDGFTDAQSGARTNSPQQHQQPAFGETEAAPIANGLPHADEPLTAPATDEGQNNVDTRPQSQSTFLSASIDGTLRIWDRRTSAAVATVPTQPGTPPWCTGACWSPSGNHFYAGRKNCTVDEFDVRKLGGDGGFGSAGKPSRVFRFQAGSGPVYALRSMPNGRHLVCASQDILRIYDLQQAETRHKTVPFTIVPGHRGGVISAIYIDPACRFMLSSAGNRGWEGSSTEVLLGYEIGVQDAAGVWHK